MPGDYRIRVAAIDCGTNSIRLLIAELGPHGKTDVLREMRIVRLGAGVDKTGRLSDEAVERTLGAVKEYASLARTLGADVVRFCATSAVRDAANAADFGDAVEQIVGVRPEVLTGEEEARASFVGATRELGVGRALVVDIGGGSTEIVIGTTERVERSVSLDIGSVRMTERFLSSDPASVADVTEAMAYLDGVIAPVVDGWEPVDTFVGVAGTVTTVAAHALNLPSYDPQAIHRAALPIPEVRAACLSLARMSVADRRALPFMHPGRADVIGAGALILDRLTELLPVSTDTLLVSEQDILDGIVWAVEPVANQADR